MGFLPSVRHGLGIPEDVLAMDDREIRARLETDELKVIRTHLVDDSRADGETSRLGRDGPRYYTVTLELPNGGHLRRNIKLGTYCGFQLLP